MARSHSRRSFLGELLQAAAGGWLALTALPTFVAGCVTKYGGPPPPAAPGVDGAVAEPSPPARIDSDLTAEYGVRRPDLDAVTSKYGVKKPTPDELPPPQPDPGVATPAYGVEPPPPAQRPPDDGPRPKYGVDRDELERTSKYGVREPRPVPAPAYGVQPVPAPKK